MPKRATLTYTSEDAPKAGEDQDLFVYYCRYSGRHAFTTDCSINKLERRRSDNAKILDTRKHIIKMYTTPGEVKLVKRATGKAERQYRLNVGTLPVAYRSEPDGDLLYIMDGAVTTYVSHDVMLDRVPVPPCITRSPAGNACDVKLEIEDKAARVGLIKVAGDAVRLHITASASHSDAVSQEVVQFFSKVLSCRLRHLTLLRGKGNRHKVLVVDKLAPEQIYEKLQSHLHKVLMEADGRAKL